MEPDNELVGRLIVDSPDPVALNITVTGAERRFDIAVESEATHHEVPIVGLRAEQNYSLIVASGTEQTELELRTGSLPDTIPTLTIPTSTTAAADNSGFTLFNIIGIDSLIDNADDESAEVSDAGLLVAVDSEGEVVWYKSSPHPIGDVRQLDDGSILHEYNDTAGRRIDLFGETLDEWGGQIITGPFAVDSFGRQVTGDDAVAVATDSMHHELTLLPDGNYATLSTELITYSGFAPEGLCGENGDFAGSYDLITDVVVVFSPDGTIVESYPLSRYFDPVNDERDQNVCGLPFDGVFPNWLYRNQGFTDASDWTHANSVVSDPTGKYLTVSVRNIDAILQIERGTGDLAWRFGPDGDFAMADPSDFPSHQHALEWQADGTLLLYDNGNERPLATSGPDVDLVQPYSRVAQYRLDPDQGVAELLWRAVSTIDGEPIFAGFVGDADRLDNGNVLVVDGGLGGGLFDDRPDGVTAKITELEPTSGGAEIVFELRISEPDRNLAVYRAERLETFYP